MNNHLGTFHLRKGALIDICQLTRSIAHKYQASILRIHNSIPYQKWTLGDLLADKDARRVFVHKWQLSKIAISQGKCIGVCIAFELKADGTYFKSPGIYIHRLAIAKRFRQQFAGALLNACTMCDAFDMRSIVYCQTNLENSNASVVRFYEDAGFEAITTKPYNDRTDVIMRASKRSFGKSRHYCLLKSQQQ